jgi:hypothetical protein
MEVQTQDAGEIRNGYNSSFRKYMGKVQEKLTWDENN